VEREIISVIFMFKSRIRVKNDGTMIITYFVVCKIDMGLWFIKNKDRALHVVDTS